MGSFSNIQIALGNLPRNGLNSNEFISFQMNIFHINFIKNLDSSLHYIRGGITELSRPGFSIKT